MFHHKLSTNLLYKTSDSNQIPNLIQSLSQRCYPSQLHFLTGIKFHVEAKTFLFTSQIKNKSKEGRVIK